MVFNDQTDAYKPVFNVLLTSKTQQIYSHAFKWIEATIDWKLFPSTITCDFKIALQNAVWKFFPGVVINGCLFHWKQAIQRKIIELNFKENICKRMMWKNSLKVFTLINSNEIRWKGIPFVRSIVDDGLEHKDFVKMEKFWMKNPSFIVTWNIFGHYKDKNGNFNVQIMD